jgi:uncharacterized protein (TIGR04255 family)
VTKSYRNPPLVEALCELRFRSAQQWDWTVPGLLYERISGKFPKKRQQPVSALQPTLGGPVEKTIEEVFGVPGRMQFFREDEKALVQVGPDLLAVNQLRPYPDWETFKEMVLEQVVRYREVSAVESLHRIGLRYINFIEILQEKIALEAYFSVFPRFPDPVPGEYNRIMASVDIGYQDPTMVLRFNLATVPSQRPSTSTFTVDLDIWSQHPETPGLDDISHWLDIGHERLELVFEKAFTDKMHREVFGEVPNEQRAGS